MKTILIIGPHADDEILGAGGYLLKSKAQGSRIVWLLCTKYPDDSLPPDVSQAIELLKVELFDDFYCLNFRPASLNTNSISGLISAFSEIAKKVEPTEILVPHYGDIHSDHRVVFQAAISAFKPFRYPIIKRILCYLTPSETDYRLIPADASKPNVFVDIGPYIEEKLRYIDAYKSQLDVYPFPRSREAIEAAAMYYGSRVMLSYSEAFEAVLTIE